MTDSTRKVKIPPGMDTPRFQAARYVEIPIGETPMIHPGSKPEDKVQERWIVHAKVFDLSDADQLKEYMDVWQQHCDKVALVCVEKGPDYDKEKNRYFTFLKWKTSEFLAPKVA